MRKQYDNSERLDGVSEKQWQEALDELTAYLRWRLRGKTQTGAHSEQVLGMPALDYYQEEAVVKLIEGEWLWQERFTLGKQLERIAADLVTKQTMRYERETTTNAPNDTNLSDQEFENLRIERRRKANTDVAEIPDAIDDDGSEEIDDTYEMVYRMVEDDVELTQYVDAIRECNSFKDLPEKMGVTMKRVYRLQEKLMRRVRRWKMSNTNGTNGLR